MTFSKIKCRRQHRRFACSTYISILVLLTRTFGTTPKVVILFSYVDILELIMTSKAAAAAYLSLKMIAFMIVLPQMRE